MLSEIDSHEINSNRFIRHILFNFQTLFASNYFIRLIVQIDEYKKKLSFHR